MAVPKIAVMALVAIMAVPILMGYAFNLDQVTETGYRSDGEPVNVTQLLQNNVSYTYAHADPATLNVLNFNNISNGSAVNTFFPVYNSFTSAKSSFYLRQYGSSQPGEMPGATNNLQNYYYVGATFYENTIDPNNFFRMNISWSNSNGTSGTIIVNHVLSYIYEDTTKLLTYSYYDSSVIYNQLSAEDIDLSYTKIGSPTSRYYWNAYNKSDSNNTSNWADLSAGYYFYGVFPNKYNIPLPDNTKSLLLTINLDSITAANYSIDFGSLAYYRLVKTTTDGVVSWKVVRPIDSATIFDLYYDPNRSDNSYQISMDLNKRGLENSTYKYDLNLNMYYIGSWQKVFGKANSFLEYSYTSTISTLSDNTHIKYFSIGSFESNNQPTFTRTPTIRMDDAYFRAFEYPVIENEEYTPSSFRTNPSTTIKDVYIMGSAFIFGGNTYNIDENGNITIGTHKIPVNNIVLDSIPSSNGGFDNRINGYTISNTADPSKITFTGQWSASISTVSLQSYNYVKTEWTAGHYAWNGVDTNFLIVGLITCLGAFIALGIYVRKTGKGLVPLLIVCGCAAGLFFCMI